jgi:exonuclease III
MRNSTQLNPVSPVPCDPYPGSTHDGERTLHVKSWNIRGNLAVGLTHRGFLHSLRQYDVNLFQESHLMPCQEESLPVPHGYSIWAISRTPCKEFTGRQWGGVVAIARHTLPIRLNEALSGPDLMVLDCGNFSLINVYVLPSGSPWESWTDTPPWDRFGVTVATLDSLDIPFIVLGNLNARTAKLKGVPHHPDRTSDDSGALNSQGRRLIELSRSCSLIILNGVTTLGSSNGRMTSFQSKDATMRASVIDYGLCSEQAWPMVTGFSVGQKEPWSDHAALALC